MGSGTTAVAAKMLGRQYVGYELNSQYHNICKNRLSTTPKEVITIMNNGNQQIQKSLFG